MSPNPATLSARGLRAEIFRHPLPCSSDPELFFDLADVDRPKKNAVRKRQEQAAALCADCPARAFCLELAIRERPEYGMYAGYTPEEIAAIADGLNAAPAEGRAA
ncbi:hypothetical protein GCM10009799_47440 [Nocardiopsis rhodophaea]|uniref:4Fe-4S Wbl-type domain-containing protein n=1 Tax=Nocardiopsis rhodophaea TaxID=280238 RepID=A0ABN2TLV9_9ACTN